MSEMLRNALITKLQDYVETLPDAEQPIFATMDGPDENRDMDSPAEILRNVKDRTAKGEQFVEDYMKLLVESTLAAKIR